MWGSHLLVVLYGRVSSKVARMGRTLDALRQAERLRADRSPARSLDAPRDRPRCHTIVVASPKGGVGKTMLSLHLAVYLRALREDMPILLWNLDGQDTLDRALLPRPAVIPGEVAFRRGLRAATVAGEFGIDVVPGPRDWGALESAIRQPGAVRSLLAADGRRGVAILDTCSRLDPVALAALAAADLTLVPVRDPVSLRQGERVWEHASVVRAVLCGVDLKVKLEGPEPDVLALLLANLRKARREHFATVISRSPKVEALTCTPDGRPRTILHAAPRSVVHRQMHALANEVLEWLATSPRPTARGSAPAPSIQPPAPEAEAARPRWFHRALPWGRPQLS